MPAKPDYRSVSCALHFLPVATRVPLKFGRETTTHVTCARARVEVRDTRGNAAAGWGETPLNVAWLWPSPDSGYTERDAALREFCRVVAAAFARFGAHGHPMEVGHLFMRDELPGLAEHFNQARRAEPLPWLAALACFSPFDIAMHDACAIASGKRVYDMYDADHMNRDLAWFYGPEEGGVFIDRYPADFLAAEPPERIVAWHLVGGRDALVPCESEGAEPNDGYPVHLADWIRRDGITCLKVKLRGTDEAWDYARLIAVGDIALAHGVEWLSPDFNCTVTEVDYVVRILDRLAAERPDLHRMILYVEQPFPADLQRNRFDVTAISERKPLFLDESAHDWRMVKLGRELGWTGVALKTCKTQTGALLSLCWARANGMHIMVQDLTNPMLAQIPHVQLAARAGTIMGVESNAMQFYPDASLPEARVHPGLYRRRGGMLDLSTLGNTGFGYRVEETGRELPAGECWE